MSRFTSIKVQRFHSTVALQVGAADEPSAAASGLRLKLRRGVAVGVPCAGPRLFEVRLLNTTNYYTDCRPPPAARPLA